MNVRRSALLLALALGCANPLPARGTIVQAAVVAGNCGTWTANATATGPGKLQVVVGGATVAEKTLVKGQTETLTATGTAPEGTTEAVDVVLGGDVRTFQVALPPPNVALKLVIRDGGVFPAGAVPAADATVIAQCPLPLGLTYEAKLRNNVFAHSEGSFTSPQRVELDPDDMNEGPDELTVELHDGFTTLASAKAELYIGDPSKDLDRDGYQGGRHGRDCDDHDASVHPDAFEAPEPNGKDDNCDGRVDEGTTAYDDDGDGLSEDKGDCDDADPLKHPGARELADCRDQDCDGTVDEGVKLPQADDSWDPNDTRAHAFNLETSRRHAFTQRLTLVARDDHDEDWFTFYSQDGDWDLWGITVYVSGMPVGASYSFEIWEDGGGMVAAGTTSTEGNAIVVTGGTGHDDSGQYLLHVDPITVTPWCPLSIVLTSG
jgi:hypothetical protein